MSQPKMEYALRRIMHGCCCEICERARGISCYYTCLEIYYSYSFDFDIQRTRQHIANIRSEYERKKRLVILYIYCRYKFLKLYFETVYAPGGSGYKIARDNFYKISLLQKK